MSSSASAAEVEGAPDQPASEKEPEIPDPREESEEEDEDDDDDEEEEKEKSLIVEGKREKKKVERLTMQVSSLQREPFTIAQGKGQKLCEIERIHFFLSKKKTDELRNLHKLLYNRPGTVSSLKKNVGQFSGFPFEKGSTQYKKKEEMLKKFRNAMLKSICEVLDLERSGVNSELVKRILNFLMHPKPSGKPLPKSKKSSSKGNKKERNSSGMARKAKRTKCPEILSDESSSDEDEKKNKEESSEDEDKESEEEPPKKTSKREKPKQKTTTKSKKSVKNANVKKADSSTTKKNQNTSKKESESEDSSDDEPLIKKLKKPPTDEELKETVKKLLASANLEEVTMKQICKKVYENYPAYDLTERKGFIKTTVKEVNLSTISNFDHLGHKRQKKCTIYQIVHVFQNILLSVTFDPQISLK
ncbi:protein DEK isoform 1-T1 [Rhynchonycteris naso]